MGPLIIGGNVTEIHMRLIGLGTALVADITVHVRQKLIDISQIWNVCHAENCLNTKDGPQSISGHSISR